MACIAMGLLGGAAMFYANVVAAEPLGLHFLLVAPLLFVVSGLALVLGSLVSDAKPREGVDALLWTPAFFREESAALRGVPAWQNYRLQAVALLALTALIVWTFR
jgi:SSS family solute:Na+ symporter